MKSQTHEMKAPQTPSEGSLKESQARSSRQLMIIQVKLVDVSEPEEARKATQKVIQTAKEVQAMTFCGCGEFLAVADATGTLSLYKSNGALLFGHRIMREDSDSVVSIKFATSEGKKSSSDAQELVVVTRLGLLLRICGLRLAAFEKLVLEKPKEALSEILRTIRFNRTTFSGGYKLLRSRVCWWNWRDMTELKEAAVSGIMSFAVVGDRGESESNSTSLLVVARAAEDANATPSFQLVEISHDDSGDANTVAVLDWTDSVYRDVALFARIGGSSHCQALAACRTEGGVTMVLLTGDHSITDDSIGSEGEESVGEDTVTMAESLVDTSISSLTHKGRMKRYQTKLDACTRCIGDSEEDSRVILKILLAVAARIREYTSSSPKLSSRMASLLHWCDEISDLSYKWTTFQLLRSSSTRDTLREKWRRFRSRGVAELLEKYMKLGNMRAVRLLWSRHVDDATVHSIGKLLEGLPASLPVSAYANWLQNEVLPLLIHQAQSQATETGTESLLDQVALWLLKRAEDAAAIRDLDSAMRICSLLKPEDRHYDAVGAADVE
ncbi:hypothetical protein PInf_017073 [Phytophthora infestans]|nr:hypothetical protein PInf_017073 [Phytophthora infestans]